MSSLYHRKPLVPTSHLSLSGIEGRVEPMSSRHTDMYSMNLKDIEKSEKISYFNYCYGVFYITP